MLKEKEYFELIKERNNVSSLKNHAFKNYENTPITILTTKEEILECEKATGQEVGIMYRDKYIFLIKDAVKFQDGSYGTYIRLIEETNSCSSTVIAPIILGENGEPNQVVLVNHFRHAGRKFYLEFPRGFGNNDVSPVENAKNEMREELGLENPESIDMIGKINPDSGLFEKEVNVFVASYKNTSEIQTLDLNEGITTHYLLTKELLFECLAKGMIQDGFTLSTLMLLIAKGIL